MEKNRADLLEERLITFGVKVALFSETLPLTEFGKKMRDQLSRSGSSAALNYGEARAAESRKDYIHKMKICLKELRETFNSLRSTKQYLEGRCQITQSLEPLLKENNELISIFVVSISRTIKGTKKTP